jgi:hypothetical protein
MRTLNGEAIVRLQAEEIMGWRRKTTSNPAALDFNRVEGSPPIPQGLYK